jgi:predicted RNA binding protein YcfA (HicA-like mRNA interferase family)
MERLLLNLGFEKVRQKGSHVFYKHSDGRIATLPNHPGKDLARPLIREILRGIDISPEGFQELLK